MKTQKFLLPLLALTPIAASAKITATATQPKAAPLKTAVAQTKVMAALASPFSMDPAAKALLDQATATYKNAGGLSFEVNMTANDHDAGQISVSFQKPNLISLERHTGASSVRALNDGTNFYLVQGTTFHKDPAPKENLIASQGIAGLAGIAVGQMLDGQNPVDYFQKLYSQKPFQKSRIQTVALPAQLLDGEMMRGVKSDMSFEVSLGKGDPQVLSQQMTFWFAGPDALLQRVEVSRLVQGKNRLTIEKIGAQKLNPTFAPGTFKFNDTGLTLASAEDEQIYWDKRLQVGTQPFAFSTKSLDGATISPANFKGKVLLMDFWATWCGPCVASLPDLQAAYNKYHAQGLEVVGISLDEDKDALTSFVKAKKMAWPQVFDGKGWGAEVPGIYGVKAIPFMLLVGKDGKIAAVNPRDNIDAAVKAALAAS